MIDFMVANMNKMEKIFKEHLKDMNLKLKKEFAEK